MRLINIDLNRLLNAYKVGYTNEGNFTTLQINLSEELSQADYYVCAFENQNGVRYPSARMQAVNGIVTLTLWQELMQSNRLILNVEAYREIDGVVAWKGKSPTINLIVHNATDSDGGVSDEQLNSLVAEVAKAESTAKELNQKLENGDFKGEKGDKGEPGEKGEQGVQGIQGEKGDKGENGLIQSFKYGDFNIPPDDDGKVSIKISKSDENDFYFNIEQSYTEPEKIKFYTKIGYPADLPLNFLGESNINAPARLTYYISRMCDIISQKTALKTELLPYAKSTSLNKAVATLRGETEQAVADKVTQTQFDTELADKVSKTDYATTTNAGIVKPDNETINVDENGVISAVNGEKEWARVSDTLLTEDIAQFEFNLPNECTEIELRMYIKPSVNNVTNGNVRPWFTTDNNADFRSLGVWNIANAIPKNNQSFLCLVYNQKLEHIVDVNENKSFIRSEYSSGFTAEATAILYKYYNTISTPTANGETASKFLTKFKLTSETANVLFGSGTHILIYAR